MGKILRVFEVKPRTGCESALEEKLSTASIGVVRGKPGNLGYYFGRNIADGDGVLVFTSVWEDIESVKANFGDDWRESYLPPGYAALIDECSVTHFEVALHIDV